MKAYPRVAFLPDTFHEVNGVAHTSRKLEAFARQRQLPFFSAHPGAENQCTTDGEVTILELARGPARFALDSNLDYDVFLLRHARRVLLALQHFKADLIHLTGPGDMGTLGCYLARRLNIPLVISWHTSLHEYASRRLERMSAFLGDPTSRALGSVAEKLSLRMLGAFYRQAEVVMAPNRELVDLTRTLTGRPVYLMERGVDAELFHPGKRLRSSDAPFRIGYVGRLTPEKNVRLLAELGRNLLERRLGEFEIHIVGEGSESGWLQDNVPCAKLSGVLRGEALARAYADLDLFVFPSLTDTYGNVILEALASGVPCVVTNSGGPKFLVEDQVTGRVAADEAEFCESAAAIMASPELHRRMRAAAIGQARARSWDSVFERVYEAYSCCQAPSRAA